MKRFSGFTLVETLLVTVLIGATMVITVPRQPPAVDRQERLFVTIFKRTWDDLVLQSLVYHEAVSITISSQRQAVFFEGLRQKRTKSYRLTMPDTLKTRTYHFYFENGMLKSQLDTIVFKGKHKNYIFTAQMTWGRLFEK